MAHKHIKIGNDKIQCKGNVLSTLLSYLKVLFYIQLIYINEREQFQRKCQSQYFELYIEMAQTGSGESQILFTGI